MFRYESQVYWVEQIIIKVPIPSQENERENMHVRGNSPINFIT